MVTNLRGRSYEDRMVEAGMTSLVDRRLRGVMIATYKIMTGKDKLATGVFFGLPRDGPGPRTRHVAGVHPIRAQTLKPKLDIKRYSFSQRVVTT